jgi:uroporphyrinogen-III synthase
VLLPRAAAAREALAVALTEAGAEVHDVATYRTITARPTPEGLAELKRGVDVATFTSASTVHHFAAIVGGDPATALGGALVACIGPLTAEAARAAGLRVDIQASDYSGEGLVAALVGHFQSSPIPGAR